jgi:hypothetical protein
MELLLYSSSKAEFEEQFLRNLNPLPKASHPERVYSLSEETGKGSFCCLPIAGGIELSWLDMTPQQTRDIRSEMQYFHSEFNYCIEASGAIEVNGRLCDGPVTAGRVQFVCGSRAIGIVHMPADKRIRQLSIELSPVF